MERVKTPLREDLEATDAEVAALSPHEREVRVKELMTESFDLYEWGIEHFIHADNRRLAATVALFSGGNDSTTLTHLFREVATHAGHANTTIGIEQTRQYVRDCCAQWDLPLLERSAPRADDHYEALVLAEGFPGPGFHYKMFQRLKERALQQIRRELVSSGWKERVIFLAGRRRQESNRRAAVPEFERNRSVVWVSPMVQWTTVDLGTYRQMFDVPRNEVSDLLHMSGECLCGSFASLGERQEIDFWFPEDFALIRSLEERIASRPDIPEYRKVWGWGSDPAILKASRAALKKTREDQPSKVGILCGSCPGRFQNSLEVTIDAAITELKTLRKRLS